MNDSEYQKCIEGLGLLTGEEIKLQYLCYREIPTTTWDGKPKKDSKKGLLVLTNDNMIFMEQVGAWSSDYSQALRIPLEQIVGISCGGFLVKHIKFNVGLNASQTHQFSLSIGCRENSEGINEPQELVKRIQSLLSSVREEKKRIAQKALAEGKTPEMIFCRFCGTRNKSDQSFCVNCKAPMT